MVVKFFLVVNSNGTTRTCKTPPDLKYNEIAIGCNLSLPNALFQKPQLSASIIVPDAAVMSEPLAADVQQNVKEAIRQATGMEVRLSFEPIDKG